MGASIHPVVIVGGGASGLFAALAIGLMGAGDGVTVLEKNSTVGRKLRATGNGRCNVANAATHTGSFFSLSADGEALQDFLERMFSSASPREAVSLVEEHLLEGAPLVEEKEGRLYPPSRHAPTFVSLLERKCISLGVRIETGVSVTRVSRRRGRFLLETRNGRTLEARSVIIAAGGRAAPATGSNGDSYSLLEDAGLRVRTPVPAMVPLVSSDGVCRRLQGWRTTTAAALIEPDGSCAAETRGDVLFTAYGLSGDAILSLSSIRPFPAHQGSGRAGRKRRAARPGRCMVRVDLLQGALPHLSPRQRKSTAGALLKGRGGNWRLEVLYPARVAAVLREWLTSRRDADGERAAELLSSISFPIEGARGWEQAQASAGGLELDELVPERMECRNIPGLYVCGEAVDVHGPCGGYNLHFAMTSALCAAKACLEHAVHGIERGGSGRRRA